MSADDAATPLASEASFSRVAFANAATTYVIIGAMSSVYGPLVLSFSHRFHLSIPQAGSVLSVHFIGSLLGVLLGWMGVKYVWGRRVLSGGLVLMAAGAVLAGFAAFQSRWILFAVAVLCIGLGFGTLDFALNTLLARTAIEGRAHRLSFANAGYGVGAVVAPLLIIALRAHNFPWIFLIIAGVSLVLSTLNGGVHAPPLKNEIGQHAMRQMKVQRRPILVTFVVAYILYVAVETASSGWLATQLHHSGYSESTGSLVTAGFWLGLALGRGLGGPIHRYLGYKTLVLGGLIVTMVLGAIAIDPSFAPYVYPLMGFVVASVFPMGLIWYTVLCPHDGDGLALIILFMMAGGILGPSGESLMVAHFGLGVVPVVVTLFALVTLATFLSVLRFRPLVVTPEATSH